MFLKYIIIVNIIKPLNININLSAFRKMYFPLRIDILNQINEEQENKTL